MAETPRTAADVLREHALHSRIATTASLFGPGPIEVVTLCHCGDRVSDHAQHQADMLAAAGLLTTAEHDREVAARTCAILQRLRGGDIEQEYIDHAISAAGEVP